MLSKVTVRKRKSDVWYSTLYGEWRGPGKPERELEMGRNGPSFGIIAVTAADQ